MRDHLGKTGTVRVNQKHSTFALVKLKARWKSGGPLGTGVIWRDRWLGFTNNATPQPIETGVWGQKGSINTTTLRHNLLVKLGSRHHDNTDLKIAQFPAL